MSTFSVTVVRINNIEPIPNADNIVLAVVNGYRSVVKKDDFKVGDLAVYIPEQSVLPLPLIQAMGLEGRLAGKEHDRVKAIKLRKCLSQGLLYPVDQTDPTAPFIVVPYAKLQTDDQINPVTLHVEVELGENVASTLDITKYEPPIPASMAGEVYNAGTHLTVPYDIENLKWYTTAFKDGEEVVFTEKLHGCADYNTLIDTVEFGMIKIGDVVRDKLKVHVASVDIHTHEFQYNLVIGYQELPNNDDWYELETEDGELVKLTGNHPVWLPDLRTYRRVDLLDGTEKVLIV